MALQRRRQVERFRLARIVVSGLIGLGLAGPVRAEMPLMERLLSWPQLEMLPAPDGWLRSYQAGIMTYTCTDCAGETVARLEVSRDTARQFGTTAQRFVAERKFYCKELVQQRRGRCASFLKTIRSGFTVFAVTDEMDGFWHQNYVILYAESGAGQVKIRMRSYADTSTILSERAFENFHADPLRLTLFW